MIPWGQWRPDSAGTNTPVLIEASGVVPSAVGFLPLEQAVASTDPLPTTCRGAVSVLKDDGSVATYAGTSTHLYKLGPLATWDDVSRSSGGDYGVGTGEQWKWDAFGTRLLATNIVDGLQYIDVVSGSTFAAVAGSPPLARYIAVVRDFVLLGAIADNEKRVQWCANNNVESWTPGTSEADYQDFPNGGPVRGVLGGEVGYVLQASKITRMTYAPGSPLIFQFDEVEGAVGLAAPHSLVRLRNEAYFMARDGIRKLAMTGGKTVPVGIGKWARAFLSDIRTGSELNIIGAANPVRPIIVWAYVARNTSGETANKLLIYDWSLDEATTADLTVEALMQWLSPGDTIDTMNSYGTLDELPFSLDSPFWRKGSAVQGVFNADHELALLSGSPMAARFTTADGKKDQRVLIKGVRPMIDTATCTVAIAARERDGDTVTYATAESLEDTGICPAHASGNIVRARIAIPAGTSWSLAQNIETLIGGRGKR